MGRATQASHLATRRKIVEACLEMNALGINQGTAGNISARIDGGLLITPSGLPYDEMTAAEIVPLDDAGRYYGEILPSSEWRMHFDIYRARPEAGAVVHAHSNYATALSCLRWKIPAFHYMVAVAGGRDIRCADYATFGTEALSANMMKALKDRSACLLANHGMICFAPSLDKAMRLAVEVETLAKQYWIASQAGEVTLLGKKEMTRVLARFKTYGKQPGAGEAGEAEAVLPPPRGESFGAPSGRGRGKS